MITHHTVIPRDQWLIAPYDHKHIMIATSVCPLGFARWKVLRAADLPETLVSLPINEPTIAVGLNDKR